VRRSKRGRRKIAIQRIHVLFHQAERRALEGRLDLAHRYVILARKLSTKYLVRMPPEYRRRYCRNCSAYLLPGLNCTVRLTGHKVVTTCHNCREIMRYPYVREIKERRKHAGGN